jgi:hypothetical protein
MAGTFGFLLLRYFIHSSIIFIMRDEKLKLYLLLRSFPLCFFSHDLGLSIPVKDSS